MYEHEYCNMCAIVFVPETESVPRKGGDMMKALENGSFWESAGV